MMPSIRTIAALALVAAALPATAYVRETTTVGHPESGLCLWWRGRQVTYRINAASAIRAPCADPARAAAAAAAGLATWAGATREGAACTDFSFVNGGTTPQITMGNDGVNLVVFRSRRCTDLGCSADDGSCASSLNCWEHGIGTIGLTTTSFDTQTGELRDADMELFAWDGVAPPDGFGFYFTCGDASVPACTGDPRVSEPTSPCNAVDVQAVVTHEAGHMLGLDHVCGSFVPPYNECPSPASVMVPNVGNVTQRALAPDDVEGVCTIYPAGGPTLTCLDGGMPKEEDSGGGCSSAGGAGVMGLLAIAFARLRVRRRPR